MLLSGFFFFPSLYLYYKLPKNTFNNNSLILECIIRHTRAGHITVCLFIPIYFKSASYFPPYQEFLFYLHHSDFLYLNCYLKTKKRVRSFNVLYNKSFCSYTGYKFITRTKVISWNVFANHGGLMRCCYYKQLH